MLKPLFSFLLRVPPNEDLETQQRAKLLALTLLTVAPLFWTTHLIAVLLLYQSIPLAKNPALLVVWAGCLLAVLPYLLNRRGHLLLAARFSVALAFCIIWVSALPGLENENPHLRLQLLYFMILPMLVSCFFLSFRETLLLAVTILLGVVVMPLLAPQQIDPSNIVLIFIFNATMTLLLIGATVLHTLLDKSRRQQLEESEAFYRSLFNSSFNAVLMHDGQKVLRCNDAAAHILGLPSPEALVGQALESFIYPEDMPETRRRIDERLATRIPDQRYILRVVRADGEPRWVDTQITLIQYQGQIVTVSNSIDITERKLNADRLQRQNHYLQTLHETALDLMNRLEFKDLLRATLQRAATLIDATSGYVYLVNEAEKVLLYETGIGIFTAPKIKRLQYGEGLAGRVWQTQKTYLVEDYSQWQHGLRTSQSSALRAAVGIPMMMQSQVIGVLTLFYGDPERRFTESQVYLLERFAGLVAIALENAWLYSSLEKQNRTLEVLHQLSTLMSSIQDVNLLLHQVTELCCQVLQGTSAYLVDWNLSQRTLTVLAEYHSPVANSAERVSDLGETYVIHDDYSLYKNWLLSPGQHSTLHVDSPEISKEEREHLQKFGGHSLFRFPLSAKGQTLGFIEVWESRHKRDLSPDEYALMADISAHAALIFDKARLYDALRSSEAQKHMMLSALPELVLRLNRNYTYLEVQNANRDDPVYNWHENFTGKNIWEVLPPYDAELAQKAVDAALATGEVQSYEFEANLRRDTRTRHYEARFVKSGEDEVIAFVRNVDNRKAAEQFRLEQKRVQLLEEFISDASHDLKTPIANLKMRTYLIRKAKDEQARARTLDVMEAEVERLERLISDLLTMAKLDSSTKDHHLEWSSVNLLVLLPDLVRNYENALRHKALELIIDMQDNLPLIWGDVKELNRLLMNLLVNAINYTQEGRIILRAKAHQEGVLIEVQDTGMGIAPEAIPRIFERFYRADAARNSDTGGTGLGLAIVKKIVELHQGWVKVSSQLRQGSTFQVWLPTAKVQETRETL